MEGKSIISYTLPASANKGLPADIKGTINGSKIDLTIPYIDNINSLIPEIAIKGKAVTPASGEPVDFTKGPVTYTVTAYDKSKKDYVVTLTRTGNEAKNISSFCFYQADNPSLDKNYCGTIAGPDSWNPLDPKNPENDTVFFILPNTDYSGKFNDGLTDTVRLMLKPRIVTSGAEVIPSCDEAVDFAFSKYAPVVYTVKARDGSEKQYSVIVDHARNNEKQIIDFYVDAAIKTEINHDALTIDVKVDPDLIMGNIIFPTITISPGATISPAPGTPIIFEDGETIVTMDYDVTAEDLTVNRYTATIAKRLNENEIESFVFYTADNPGLATTVSADTIDTDNAEVIVYVPNGTNRNGLVPTITISPSAQGIVPASGIAQDFSIPVTYSVTAENDEIKDWIVYVYEEPDTSCDILTFDLLASQNPELEEDFYGVVGTDNVDIYNIPYHTDLSNLIPVITISGVSVTPASGTPRNFTLPATYTVEAESGDTHDYTVTLHKTDPGTEKEIIAFNFLAAENGDPIDTDVIGAIDHVGETVTLTVPFGTDRSALVPDIQIPEYASVDPVDGTAQDFSNSEAIPVEYTVTAQDDSTKVYAVTVYVAPPSTECDIVLFRFLAVENDALDSDITGAINSDTAPYTVKLLVPPGTDVTELVPDIAISQDATGIMPDDDGVPVDYTDPIVYTVTAQDGSTTKDYTVTVEIIVEVSEFLVPDGKISCSAVIYDTCGAGYSNNWQCVNDFTTPPDAWDDASYYYVNQYIGRQDATHSIQDLSGEYSNIVSVKFNLRVAGIYAPGISSGSTFYFPTYGGFNGGKVVVGNTGGAFSTYSYTHTINPLTANKWTWEDVNNIETQIGIEDGARVSEVWIEVTYTPEVGMGNDITSYKFLDSENDGDWGFDINGTIDTVAQTVDISVPANIPITSLVPDIQVSPLATVNPADGVAQNFETTNPVTYTVTPQNPEADPKYYTVTVNVVPLSDENDILTFDFLASENGALSEDAIGVVDTVAGTVSVSVPVGTTVTNLIPTITVSDFAAVSPGSGIEQDFTNSLDYTVTAQNGDIKVFTVTVSEGTPVAATEIIRPNAAGDETAIFWQTANPHWAQVDEISQDSYTSNVSSFGGSAGTWRDLYNLTDHTGSGTITSIEVYWCVYASYSTANARGAIKTNGTVYETSNLNPPMSFTTYSQIWNNNPQTGSPWTWSEIDALQAGVTLTDNGTSDAYCTQIYVEVNYEYYE